MPKIDFSSFPYYPSIRCTEGEHIGYQHLSDEDKNRLLPIFELSQHGEKGDFESALGLIENSAGKRSFILDFCREQMTAPTLPKSSKDPEAAQKLFEEASVLYASYTKAYNEIMDSTDGYARWRKLVSQFPNAVPVVLFDDVVPKQILRQAVMLSRLSESLAIRISRADDPKIFPIVAQIASVLESTDRLLIILDAGYSRRGGKGVDFARDAISQITRDMSPAERAIVRVVFVSSSFPHLKHAGLAPIENLDWEVWREVADYFPVMFGDYAAMYRHPLRAVRPHGWRAQVVYPLDEEWLTYRHPNSQDKSGWISGAKKIEADEKFQSGAPNIWGTDAIRSAAKGNIAGLEWPRDWYGVKVNIHLHQQIKYTPIAIDEFEADDED